jgi:hypothetical protein
MDTNERVAQTESRQRRWQRSQGAGAVNPVWLTAVAPLAISILSLGLSVFSIFEATREPEIWLSAPDVVRVATGEAAWFYVQPRLVSAARNDRVAVVAGLRLEMTTPDGKTPVTLVWDEQGTWQYDTVNRGLTWIFVADAAPLVVSPSSPQLPYCLFLGPPDWQWQAGDYLVTIVATSGRNAEALRTSFKMTLPAESAEFINEQPRTWVEVRTDTSSTPPS